MPGFLSMKISALESNFKPGPAHIIQLQWESNPSPPGPKA